MTKLSCNMYVQEITACFFNACQLIHIILQNKNIKNINSQWWIQVIKKNQNSTNMTKVPADKWYTEFQNYIFLSY